MTCGKIVPRQEEVLLGCGCLPDDYDDGYLAECVLPNSHSGPCVFLAPNGKYVIWEDDDCDCCPPTDADRCIVYGEITQTQFERRSHGG